MIIATAGHVDHGKTALVRALTGVETDRLAEEQRRGLTIELGYAYGNRADARWGFVDVPGHERFMATSLAGLAAARLALLAVAADEGPKPQTEAHLRCLQGFAFPGLVVALTRCDLASEAQQQAAEAALGALLERYGFSSATVVPTSIHDPASLEALWTALEATAAGLAEDAGRRAQPVRIALDRAFSLPGAGTIATGLLFTGTLHAGDPLWLLPEGRAVTVASLRANDQEVRQASAGDRVALRLPGLATTDIKRGSWLAGQESHPVTRRLELALEWFDAPPPQSQLGVHVHHGPTHTLGRLQREPRLSSALGNEGATLRCEAPLMACHGDRLLLRDDRGDRLLAAATVLDPLPPSRGRWSPPRLQGLAALHRAAWEEALRAALAAAPLELDLAPWSARLNRPERQLQDALPEAEGSPNALREQDRWKAFKVRIEGLTEDHHQAHPEQLGLRLDELARALERPPRGALEAALRALLDEDRLVLDRNRYRLPAHRPTLDPADLAAWERLAHHFIETPRQPPTINDIAKAEDLDPKAFHELCLRWHHGGRLLQISKNRFLLPEGVSELEAALRMLAAEAQEGFDARAFRDAAAIGRNTAIDVLEYFDRVGLTRRRGNHRVFLGALP
jgi:selenocysteine-specific elongation factor